MADLTEYNQTPARLAGHGVETAGNVPPGAKGVVVIAHGRINDLNHPSLLAAAEGAHQAGWGSLRFNFPYRQRDDAQPDSFSILIEVHAAAAQWALDRLPLDSRRLVLAGKSMGARTAVEAAKSLPQTEGLLFLGYPLHPPDDPGSLRDEPLYGLSLPMGIIQGDSDALCDLKILGQVLARIRPAPALTVSPGADHGFGIPQGDHGPPPRTLEAIQEAARTWLQGLG